MNAAIKSTLAVPKTPAIAAPLPIHDEARFAGLDALRLVAAFGVVWLHCSQVWRATGPFSPANLGEFAVPFFTGSLIFFSVQSVARKPGVPLAGVISARARRLLVPFVVWSVIVYGLLALNAMRKHEALPALSVWSALEGPTPEYWFLTWAFLASTISAALARILLPRRALLTMICIGAFAAAMAIYFIAFPAGALFGGSPPFVLARYWRELSMACWAFGFSGLVSGYRVRIPRHAALAILASAASLAVIVVMGCVLPTSALFQFAGGLLILGGLLMPNWRWLRRPAQLGSCVFALYVIHVIVLWPVYAVVRKLPANHLGILLAAAAAAYGATFIVVLALKKLHAPSWLVP